MCCHSVASLLPVLLPLKHLSDNDVTDVATCGTAISDAGCDEGAIPFTRFIFPIVCPANATSHRGRAGSESMVRSNLFSILSRAKARRAEMAAETDRTNATGLPRAIRWRLAKMEIKANQGQSRLIKPNQPFIFFKSVRDDKNLDSIHRQTQPDRA
jgi:hypothetical protein